MRIIIIDDDFLIITALKTILESAGDIDVLTTATDGLNALPLYKVHRPDVVLMDIRMQQMNGLDAAQEILSFDPNAKILLLTTFSDDEYIIKALNIGVKGYLLKQDYANIAPSLHTVHSGQNVFGNEVASKIPNLLSQSASFDYSTYQIGEREYEVIELVSQGYSNKEISEKLFLSEGTIRNYLSNILDKLDLRDRTQLAIFFYQHKARSD